ncbi:putative C6 transcription factor [Talaromyces proteolyticus]|uniref:C6 transcription factor n=1 Tax=Talaromyces proteolyticus TaxID=1131652 RepID=A0AAD4KGD2_9EURO|nr:putative C6 transcription factor [Talaromyces proteolyticus]KAH8688856.1 putative C6 transcription factor [Talaromyces proteolyticus]
MTARQSTPSSEHSAHSDNVRKRVCKACDRCRLKKSKCDGASPCGRCRADNAICVFGERKKAHDKVYPKGYVEMLEQQQVWLVNGLQELYRRAHDGDAWTGEPLKLESNGHPLTHDLLTKLGALDHSKGEHFEENVDVMQHDLWRQNNGYMQRQESSDGSSDTAHSPVSHHNNNSSNNESRGGSRFADAFARHQLPPTPPSYSPSSRTQHLSIKQEQQQQQHQLTPAFQMPAQVSQQQGVNPMALQSQQTWPGNELGSFDDIDMMGNQYTLFDEQIQATGASPMYGRQMSMQCLPPSMLFDANDDFNQYFNPNTEIPSI